MMVGAWQQLVIFFLFVASRLGNTITFQHQTPLHYSTRSGSSRNSLLLLSAAGTTGTSTTDVGEDKEDHYHHHYVSIDYCTGCRWMLRSAWMAQELLTTFQDELDSVTLIPSRPPASPGGVFTVRINEDVIWDRKQDGGFPESKQLKQRIRNRVAPERFLGHSDTDERRDVDASAGINIHRNEDCVDCDDNNDESQVLSTVLSKSLRTPDDCTAPKPNVAITYCIGCRWLLRAAWVAQELLTTFETEIASVSLIPSRPPAKGGIFTVSLDDELIWDRTEEGRFPQPKELKQRIRDRVAPLKDLGHSDVQEPKSSSKAIDMMDDDEAAELRRQFGVM